jgi:HAD superfamily hydrolase (TIGR01509 family)
MEEERMIQALIFDFDGVILDTETPCVRSWQEVFREHGKDLSVKNWAFLIHRAVEPADPVERLEQRLGYPVDRQVICKRRMERELELLEVERPLPGVEDILAEAERLRLKLAVASNSSRDWVTGHLIRLGLRARFDSILCAEDTGAVKPDPAVYRATLDALHIQASQAIAFEDSPRGILAAKRSGIYCVAVPNLVTASLSTSRADMVLSSLTDVSLKRILALVSQQFC